MIKEEIVFPEITRKMTDDLSPSERTKCGCGAELHGLTVMGYPHDDGFSTPKGKMWLFIRCPRCGIDRSLWKMGMSRSNQFLVK